MAHNLGFEVLEVRYISKRFAYTKSLFLYECKNISKQIKSEELKKSKRKKEKHENWKIKI